MRNLMQKTLLFGAFLSVSLPSAFAEVEGRPFASESYCLELENSTGGVDQGSSVFMLLEKTLEDEWVYSLMGARRNNEALAFKLYDGGNSCSMNVVGAQRNIRCSNFNSEAVTNLSTSLNYDELTLRSDKDITLRELEDESVTLNISKGELRFSLRALAVCTKAL